jgi:acetyl esterase/lipase
VLVIHGGGFTKNDRSETTGLAQSLAAAGYVAMNIDYRLAPQWVYPAPEQDALAAVAWLRSQAYVQRVTVFGISSGAIMVDWLVGQGAIDRGVAWSGGGSFDPAVIGTHAAITAIEPHVGCAFASCPEQWAAAAPLAWIGPGDPPLFQVHSTFDPVLSVASARAMVDAYRAAGNAVTFIERPGEVHGGDFWADRDVRQQTLEFLRSP